MRHLFPFACALYLATTALAGPAEAVKPVAKTRPPAEHVKLAASELRATGAGWTFLCHYPRVLETKLKAVDARFAQDAVASERAFRAELKETFGSTMAPAPVPVKKKDWSRREVTNQVRHNGGLLAIAFDQIQFLAGGPHFYNFQAFLPTSRGLSIFFQPGQATIEANNAVEITVGWPQLRGLVKPAIEKAALSP